MILDWPSLLVGALAGGVIGAPIGLWLTLFSQRPKLVATGHGGGSGPFPGINSNYLRIENRPGLFGISLGETIVFGRVVHTGVKLGLPVERAPARDCEAVLIDIETKERISLSWRSTHNPGQYDDMVTLGVGQAADLMFFAKPDLAGPEYFIFKPDTSDLAQPELSPNAAQFTTSRAFRLEIRYSGIDASLKYRVSVERTSQGALRYKMPTGGGSF